MKTRQLTADEVEFTLTVEADDLPVRGAFDLGDPEETKKLEDELIARLERGDVWAKCIIKVTAKWGTWKGDDYLCGCSYRDEDQFTQDQYYEDMKFRALENLNDRISVTVESLKELLVP